MKTKTCPTCNAVFTASVPNKKYCRVECRSKEHRKIYKSAYNEYHIAKRKVISSKDNIIHAAPIGRYLHFL